MNKFFKLVALLGVTQILSMQEGWQLESRTLQKLNEIFEDPCTQTRLEKLLPLIKSNPGYIDIFWGELSKSSRRKNFRKTLFVSLMLDSALQGRFEILEKFTKKAGFNVNFSCFKAEQFNVLTTPIHLAVEELDVPLIEFLLKHKADISKRAEGSNITPLESYERYVGYLEQLGHQKPKNYKDMIKLLTPGQ